MTSSDAGAVVAMRLLPSEMVEVWRRWRWRTRPRHDRNRHRNQIEQPQEGAAGRGRGEAARRKRNGRARTPRRNKDFASTSDAPAEAPARLLQPMPPVVASRARQGRPPVNASGRAGPRRQDRASSQASRGRSDGRSGGGLRIGHTPPARRRANANADRSNSPFAKLAASGATHRGAGLALLTSPRRESRSRAQRRLR